MADEPDIVRDIIDRFMREVPGVTVECAYRIEVEARNRWGGQRAYVQRNPDRETRRSAAITAWKSGVPISSVSESLGIDRSTMYRLLKQGK